MWRRERSPTREIRISMCGRGILRTANFVGGASQVCILGLVSAIALASCAASGDGAPISGQVVHTGISPSASERYCAWFGDARGSLLYFGQSAFWSASRGSGGARGSAPRADLRLEGPTLIGRFDLRRERLLEPIDVGRPGDRSGVWDVLAHPNGRVYFTTYFEAAGYLDPGSGEVHRLPGIGRGLNELAPGPGGSLLISRYGEIAGGGSGSVVMIDADGALLAEHRLQAPDGFSAAPKTVAHDPRRDEIWVTTDLFPEEGGAIRHGACVLDASGKEKRRIEHPEIQFVVFAEDGTGYRAEVEGHALWLRIVRPERGRSGAEEERRVLLDDAFPAALDFAQDIQLTRDGHAVVTRWSGWVHVVDPSGAARALRLPRLDPEGLYYTAVLADGRICATHCAEVTVVCADAPES